MKTPAEGMPKGVPLTGLPSDYEPRWNHLGEYEHVYNNLIVALTPVIYQMFWSDTERGKRIRNSPMAELLGEEEAIAQLAISQAFTTINRMKDPYAS